MIPDFQKFYAKICNIYLLFKFSKISPIFLKLFLLSIFHSPPPPQGKNNRFGLKLFYMQKKYIADTSHEPILTLSKWEKITTVPGPEKRRDFCYLVREGCNEHENQPPPPKKKPILQYKPNYSINFFLLMIEKLLSNFFFGTNLEVSINLKNFLNFIILFFFLSTDRDKDDTLYARSNDCMTKITSDYSPRLSSN